MPRNKNGSDVSVGFLFHAMRNRDPNKRQVKPVANHLLQTDFADDDSEDDSDFQVNMSDCSEDDVQPETKDTEAESASVDVEVKSNLGSVEDDSFEVEDTDESDQDSDSDSDESTGHKANRKIGFFDAVDSDEDEDYVPKKKLKMDKQHVEKQRIKSPEVNKVSVPTTEPSDSRPMKVLICCVCLGDISETDDEIVECDNCGVAVHEGCYGISDNQSNASTESSASTEPWFCDACKAGLKPTCELCPNEGGIFKETDAGKWVHLVCALYTPGVAFGDVDKLSPVTLFEMPYSKWGAKECSLCEDLRFARTGVCVSCDAGMCRSFFHVTCAQRNGLLSEASPDEVQDIADPFFAYCKLHADKITSRAKRRNYLAIQSHVRQHAVANIQDEKEKARFVRKLNVHQQKYVIAKANRPPSWVPPQKLVRYLTSSPSVVKKMLRKAELMGIITQSQHEVHSHDKGQERKKSHLGPALNTEFVTYYLDRNIRIDKIKADLKEQENQKEKLQQQNHALRLQYDKVLKESARIQEVTDKLNETGDDIWLMLSEMVGRPLSPPPFLRRKHISLSPTQKSRPQSKATVINHCGICSLSHDQHLLAHCDKCQLWYHLGCLNPPLTRMPKKTSRMGWQCSECAGSSSEETEEVTTVNVNAPRRLRDKIKEPAKYSKAQEDMEFLFPEFNRKTNPKKKPKKTVKKEKEFWDAVARVTEIDTNVKAETKTEPTEQKSMVWHTEKIDLTQHDASSDIARSSTPVSLINISDESSIEVEVKIEEQTTPIPKQHPQFQDVSRTGRKIIKKKHYDEDSEELDTSPKQDSSGKKAPVEKEKVKSPEPKPSSKKLFGSHCITCSKPGTRSNMVSCDRCFQCFHFGCLDPPFKHTPKPRGYTWFCEGCDSSDNSSDDEM